MYLINATTQTFWQLITNGSNTEVSWGKIGCKGRVLAKQHTTAEDANAYAIRKVIEKKKIGYIEATPIRKSRRINTKQKKVKNQTNKRKARKRTPTSNMKRKKKSSTIKKKDTRMKPSKRMILQARDKTRGRVGSNVKFRVNKRKKLMSKSSNKPDPKKPQTKRRKKISTTKDSKKKFAMKKSKSVPLKMSATGKKTPVKRRQYRPLYGLTNSSQDLVSGRVKSYEVYTQNGMVYDAMLNIQEETTGWYYILQVLKSNRGFYCSWREGMTGYWKEIPYVLGPFRDHKPAVEQFEKEVEEKTGVAWRAKNSLLGKSNPNSRKYSILRRTSLPPTANVIWQYWSYTTSGWVDHFTEIEKLWQQHQANASANLDIRIMWSINGTYRVDFRKMEQTRLYPDPIRAQPIRRIIK